VSEDQPIQESLKDRARRYAEAVREREMPNSMSMREGSPILSKVLNTGYLREVDPQQVAAEFRHVCGEFLHFIGAEPVSLAEFEQAAKAQSEQIWVDRIYLYRNGWVSPWITGIEPEAKWIDPLNQGGDRVTGEVAMRLQLERDNASQQETETQNHAVDTRSSGAGR